MKGLIKFPDSHKAARSMSNTLPYLKYALFCFWMSSIPKTRSYLMYALCCFWKTSTPPTRPEAKLLHCSAGLQAAGGPGLQAYIDIISWLVWYTL